MAKNNLKINGVVYNEVEEINIPLATDTTQIIKFVNTSDADATEADITKGKTAWVNGVKRTGTHTDPVISATDGVLSIS